MASAMCLKQSGLINLWMLKRDRRKHSGPQQLFLGTLFHPHTLLRYTKTEFQVLAQGT